MECYEAAYTLLKAALWGQDRYPLKESAPWREVYRELGDHAVSALVMDVLPEAPGLEEALKMEWIGAAAARLRFWNKLMKEQDAVVSLLDQAEIPFVILKGTAAAMYYPQPEYRSMGDVDLIVKPEDFERTDRLLREAGYAEGSGTNRRHTEFRKNGVTFELHRYFSQIGDAETAGEFDALIFRGIERCRRVSAGRYRVPVLGPVENGLVLMGHIDQHLENGLGLRQIIDWMLYVDRELDDEAWQREFGPLAERLGLKKLTVTVTRMCQLYLGLREEGITWCAGAEEELCRELMELTMRRGNFGQKTSREDYTPQLLSSMSKITNIPRILQENGCRNWKALEKYPFLKPFAWLYQLFRYIVKGFSRKNPLRQLAADLRQSGRQDDLMTRLGVSRRIKHDRK